MDYRKSIQDSLDYIEDNLKAPITATELSEQVGILCSIITGCSNQPSECR